MFRHSRYRPVLVSDDVDSRGVRHVAHAKAAAAGEDPAETFEEILARLVVRDLREAKVKDLSAICGRLGIARTGEALQSQLLGLSTPHGLHEPRECILHHTRRHQCAAYLQVQTKE